MLLVISANSEQLATADFVMKKTLRNPSKREQLRLLLVDDDSYSLKLMTRQLSQLGVTDISVATDGATALARLQQEPKPSLIFCDLQMPTMNGLELLRQLNFEAFTGDIVIVSGESSGMLRSSLELIRAYGLQPLAGLSKPVDLNTLANILDRAGLADGAEAEAQSAPCEATSMPAGVAMQLPTDIEFSGVVAFPMLSPDLLVVKGLYIKAVSVLNEKATTLNASALATADGSLAKRHMDEVLPLILAAAGKTLQQKPDWTLSLDLPATLLSDQYFPDRFNTLALAASVPVNQIRLQLTGSIEQRLPESTLVSTGQLALAGISIWAAGHDRRMSELEQLLRLPLKGLVLDPGLLERMRNSDAAAKLFSGTISMLQTLGLEFSVLEVHDESMLKICQDARPAEVSGLHVAPAIEAELISDWVKLQESAGNHCS